MRQIKRKDGTFPSRIVIVKKNLLIAELFRYDASSDLMQ